MAKPKTCGNCRWFVVHGDGSGDCTLNPQWVTKNETTRQCKFWRKK